ncbi:helix-turn-helix domain-containing protein [Spirillospora sp. CA-255316]
MTTRVKRTLKHRFRPGFEQAAGLARTFGCVRTVCDPALAARGEACRKTEAASVPLKRAFGERARCKSAGYSTSALGFRDGGLPLVNTVWSRPLPECGEPSTVTVPQGATRRRFVLSSGEKSSWVKAHRETENLAVRKPPEKGRLTRSMPECATVWCGGCGTAHGGDVNAARDIPASESAVSACGAGVRPQRESSRTGRSATKQELLQHQPQESPPSGGGRRLRFDGHAWGTWRRRPFHGGRVSGAGIRVAAARQRRRGRPVTGCGDGRPGVPAAGTSCEPPRWVHDDPGRSVRAHSA